MSGNRVSRLPALVALVVVVLVVVVPAGGGDASAFPSSAAWCGGEHRYRMPIDVTTAVSGRDLTAVAQVDFTTAFAEAGAAGAILDPATLVVHEIGATGALVDAAVAFQFDPGPGYDPAASAVGELVIHLGGASMAGVARHFAVYFEQAGVVTTPPSIPSLLTVDEDATDEGRDAVVVTTPGGAWYYDRAGGAFSSLVDGEGNDWIDWHPTGGAAGNFRGIPNLVYPEGHMHPGDDAATTTVEATGPVRAVLTSTAPGPWVIRWEVFPSHARGTVLAASGDYWFLYEGTPGGSVETTVDHYLLPDGSTHPLHERFTADIQDEEWIAFADPVVGRSLVLANHTDDASVDSYRTLDGEMTVFGFGRDGTTPTMSGAGRAFSVGFVDAVDHGGVVPVASGRMHPPTVTVGGAQTAVLATTGPCGPPPPPPPPPPTTAPPPPTTAPPQGGPGGGPTPAPGPTTPGGGYVVLEADSSLYAFGGARARLRAMDPSAIDVPARGATVSTVLVSRANGASAVAIERTADGRGLWVLLDDGRILPLGSARPAPGVPAAMLTRTVAGQPERVSAMARVSGGDLWLFTTAGRVVPQFGTLPPKVRITMDIVLGLDLVGPVVDAEPTIDGTGVLAMAADGGIFAYDAPFLGSVYDAIASVLRVPVGSVGPDRPVVGITMDTDAHGYWVVAEDGGVFTMHTPFRGALPAIVPFHRLVAPVNGMVPLGAGYLLVAGDGGVFNFSDQPFAGSAAGLVDTPVVGIGAL